MAYPATLENFKTRFDRDFNFGPGKEAVRDVDVNNALAEANSVFNEALWDSDESVVAFLFAAAHCLVLNLQASGGLSASELGQGAESRGGGVIQAKSVGGVSVTYVIPEHIAQSPILSQFMRTDYGQRYLQMLVPRLVGHGEVIGGWDDVTQSPEGF